MLFSAISTALALFCTLPAHAAPPRARRQKTPAVVNRSGRQIVSLNGDWQFKTDPGAGGETAGWQTSIPAGTEQMAVPDLWQRADRNGYHGAAWYWRTFTVPANWKGQTVRLAFGAVMGRATIWLNGARIGDHSDPVTPFEFNITRAVQPDKPGMIAVRVDSGSGDGGIWQGVNLLAHDEAYIESCSVTGDAYGNVTAAIVLNNTSSVTGSALLTVDVSPAARPKERLKQTGQVVEVSPGKNVASFAVSAAGKDAALWNPEKPALFHFDLGFRQGDDILDSVSVPFGFRQLAAQNGSILLNGVPIILHAALRGDLPPRRIVTPDELAQMLDMLQKLHDSGVNLVGFAAPPPGLLDAADRMGMCVVEGPDRTVAPEARLDEMRDLIARDRSHPCIVAWWAGAASREGVNALRLVDTTRFIVTGQTGALKMTAPGDASASAAVPPAIDQIVGDYP